MIFKYIICLVLVVFSFVGCSIKNTTLALPNNISDTSISDSEAIDEAIDIDNNDVTPSEDEFKPKLDEIKTAVSNVIGDKTDNIALYYYNINTKEEFAINEDVYHITASLRKVPLAMQVLDKVNSGEISLDTEIEYIPSDFSDGTGTLQFEEFIGSRPISELIELSMKESDNIAANMLNRFCGYTLSSYVNDMLGEEAYLVYDDGYSKLTAKHHFKILYNLYTNLENNTYYSLIIDHLKDTEFNDSINKYLPEDVVSHKIGSYFRSYHDMGIIFGEQDYILVVLTKDIGELVVHPDFADDDEERYLIDWGKEAFELIAQISKSIYEIVEDVTLPPS